jgi:hypothetical protein
MVLVIAGCGPGGAGAQGDGGPVTDAKQGSDGKLAADAGVAMTNVCGSPQSYVTTTTTTSGSTTVVAVSTTKYALVDVNPQSNWSIAMCGESYVIGGTPLNEYPCAGSDCVATGTPPPNVYDGNPNTCQWSHDGVFSGNQLVVSCGTSSVQTVGSAAPQTISTVTYASVTLYQ